ncbi:MAG: YhbY family RNA-binding protein [Nanoarchaeota archaeon]|nr:YhbY family RNA-binding protein [Nanoarchaeota archaeon]MEC8339528.1 YhbY family RNA-binding protein [Nanoarchaeota archaeon]
MDKELKKAAADLKAEFNLGKNGITDTFLDSINKNLQAHSLTKIKCSLAEDKDALKYYAQEVAKELGATLVETRGYTFTLYKE